MAGASQGWGAEEKARWVEQANAILKDVAVNTAAIRAEMTKKYGIEF